MRACPAVMRLLTLGIALWGTAALGDDPPRLLVEELGEPAAYRFEGVQALSPDDLVAALEEDILFQIAARPQGNFRTLLATIAERLALGYRNSGFPQARVTARWDLQTNELVIAVEEGPRYLAGDVVVEGAQRVDVDAMASFMIQPQPPAHSPPPAAAANGKSDDSVRWAPGKPASFVPQTWRKYEPRIKEAFAAQGFHFARYEWRVEADHQANIARLVVEILNEGPVGVVDAVKISGLERHTRQQVLEYVELRTPVEYSPSLAATIEEKLRRSGRFIFQRVTTEPPAASGESIRMSIVVREHPTVPLLGEPLLDWQLCLLKLCDWLEQWPASDDDLVLSISKGTDDPNSSHEALSVRCVASPRQGLLTRFACDHAAGKRLDHTLLASHDRLMIGSPLRKARFDVPMPFSSRSGVVIHFKEVGKEATDEKGNNYNVNFGAEVRHKKDAWIAPLNFVLRFDSVAMIAKFGGPETRIEWTDDDLLLATPSMELSVDRRSGRLRRFAHRHDDHRERYEFRCEPRAYQRALAELDRETTQHTEGFDAARPLASLGEYLWHDLARYVDAAGDGGQTARVQAVGRLVKSSLAAADQLWQQWSSLPDRGEAFIIPDEGPQGTARLMSTILLKVSRRAFPRDTPLWSLGREVAFHMVGYGRSGPREYAQIAQSRTTGPLACLAGALMLKYVDAESSRRFAFFGRQRLDARYVENDCRMLLSGDCFTRELLLTTGEALRQYDRPAIALLVRFAADPPREAALADAAWRFNEDDRSPQETLPELVAALWEAGLREPVANWLDQLSAAPRPVEPQPIGAQAP